MKNRSLILVTLLLICALVPLQRATATVTISALDGSSRETGLNVTGDIEFTVRVTSEAGDEYEDIGVSVTAIGLAVGDTPGTTYPAKPDPDKLDDIKGAGTQDVTIELDRSEIKKVDTITFTVQVEDDDETLDLSQTLTLSVLQTLTAEIYVVGYRGGNVIHKLEDNEISNNKTVNLDLNISNFAKSSLTFNVTLPTSRTVFGGEFDVNMDTSQITMYPPSGSETVLSGKKSKFELEIPGHLLKLPGVQTFDGRSYFFKIVMTYGSGKTKVIDVRINVTVKCICS